MSRISKGKEILDSLPRIESDPKEDLMKLKRIHEVMRKHKEKAKTKMTKEQAKSELIEVLMNQVEQLSTISKIELGDDVVGEINRLQEIIKQQMIHKFEVGDKAYKPKGYKFPCTIVAVFETVEGNVRVVGEMDDYGLLHIFNEQQLEHYG